MGKKSKDPLGVGREVRAAGKVVELGFLGSPLHVHANEGDIGRVQEVDGEWRTVTWARTGTTTDCHVSELAGVEGDDREAVRWVSEAVASTRQ